MARGLATGTRCAALVGPYLSGKTTLLEALLFATGAIKRKGTVKDGNSIGDSAPEARARQMSTEPTFAQTEFLGDEWTLIDCPGSIELFQDTVNSMAVADVAIVVCEPDPQKAIAIRPIIQYLQKERIPHMIFINKMDQATEPVQTILEAIQQNSEWPLVLRELPIVAGEKITGYVDLVSERAFQYRAGQASMMISIPGQIEDEKALARQEMLEALADFDDSLLEQLLEDVVPPTEEIYAQVTRDMQNGLILPVFLGIADQDHGVRRLLKALRHEVPGPGVTAERFGIKDQKPPKALVFKTLHAAQLGKLSIARIFSGEIDEGIELQGKRVGAMLKLMGNQQVKVTRANLGEVVAFGRLSDISTGYWLGPENEAEDLILGLPEALSSVFGLALETNDRSDEVKLTSALQRLCDEDPSLTWRQDSDVNQLVLEGQGDIHLQLAIDRLENRYKISVRTSSIQVPYKETIKKQISQHARYKRQTGGHGMFGDVHVDIKPLERGKGFEFHETIVGGSVPKQYIPAVEAGVRDYLQKGALGFPVVDISVTLTDGQYHAVDSNEMSFKLAAREAMKEGLPKCSPILLEPICRVEIDVPADFSANVHGLVSTRRGHIMGFEARAGQKGWETVSGFIPQSEIKDLIVELRSLSHGLGTFRSKFDHFQECTGSLADRVIGN
ncbi:MAG: elongation factor G [Rhodospirillaceae bacterium]